MQHALSSSTWECLWQAFQEVDRYNSYHVSDIDHCLSVVVRVPNGKPVFLILKKEKNKKSERKRINKYKWVS